MKITHTKNGNIKLTVTVEQAKVIDWALTYARYDGTEYFTEQELVTARELVSELDAADLY